MHMVLPYIVLERPPPRPPPPFLDGNTRADASRTVCSRQWRSTGRAFPLGNGSWCVWRGPYYARRAFCSWMRLRRQWTTRQTTLFSPPSGKQAIFSFGLSFPKTTRCRVIFSRALWCYTRETEET